MMRYTDRHCRFFLRQITRRSLLYTEMITTQALEHGNRAHFLRFDPIEHPVAVQLGGSEPQALARSSRYAEQWGYDEVNLNVGCPSDRVTTGRMGACLMKEPMLVADCVRAMRDAVTIPITVKHRIGVDGRDSQQELVDFVGQVAEAGCRTFIVHARIAILKGLNPKENRDIPPLQYERVYQLKETFPDLEIIINGGIKEMGHARELLRHVDGVMIGREAYHNPWILAAADSILFGQPAAQPDRHDVVRKMVPYIEQQLASRSCTFGQIARHMLGLFNGMAGARRYRRYLSERMNRKEASAALLQEAGALCMTREHLTAGEPG